jgi:hypothetical protein
LLASVIACDRSFTSPMARNGTKISSKKSVLDSGSSAMVGATKCPRPKTSPRSRVPPSRMVPSRAAWATAFSHRCTARSLMTGPNQTSRRVTSPMVMARVFASSFSTKAAFTLLWT